MQTYSHAQSHQSHLQYNILSSESDTYASCLSNMNSGSLWVVELDHFIRIGSLRFAVVQIRGDRGIFSNPS